MNNVDTPYDRHALQRYLDAKLASAVELYAAGKIQRVELLRCEVDRLLMTDSGPIKMKEPK